MAYLDDTHNHKRIAGVTGVAAIHVVLAFGLVTGLAIKGGGLDIEDPFEGTFIDLPDPPPPDDPPPPVDDPPPAAADPPTAPMPPVVLTPPSPIEVTPIEPPTRPVIRVPAPPAPIPAPPPPPPPPPAPRFTAKAPAPTNGPAGWVTNDDYPSLAVRRELEGSASYALEVNARGRVDSCRVTRSTGHDVLDDATCNFISRRARFEPATDTSGAEVAGTYQGRIDWRLPE